MGLSFVTEICLKKKKNSTAISCSILNFKRFVSEKLIIAVQGVIKCKLFPSNYLNILVLITNFNALKMVLLFFPSQ